MWFILPLFIKQGDIWDGVVLSFFYSGLFSHILCQKIQVGFIQISETLAYTGCGYVVLCTPSIPSVISCRSLTHSLRDVVPSFLYFRLFTTTPRTFFLFWVITRSKGKITCMQQASIVNLQFYQTKLICITSNSKPSI